MVNKSHKNCLNYHKDILESERHRFRCKREFNLVRNGAIHAIDLACFRKPVNQQTISSNQRIEAVGIEAESSKNFNSAQIKSNMADLKEFKKIHPKSKIFQIHVDEEIDFSKELNPRQRFPIRRF